MYTIHFQNFFFMFNLKDRNTSPLLRKAGKETPFWQAQVLAVWATAIACDLTLQVQIPVNLSAALSV